jgi:glycosyltransferase involved in cell wall biosynthesis
MAPGQVDFGPVRILSASPPILLSGIPYDEYLGIARAFAARHGNVEAGFVIFPTWTIESSGFPEAIRQRFLSHIERYPRHELRFICNTPKETELLTGAGLPATFLNKNFMVSDRIFHPIPTAEVEFDAVYNARFVTEKRHELAAAIPRVGYIAYLDQEGGRREQFHALLSAALSRNPDHALLNEIVDGQPAGMSHEQVNAALNRAAVGLLLSDREGSSYASMEYMLAGLPVVSTPSRGGRDVFFDPEYCIVCEPDPRTIRDAVAALRARSIPRAVVRERTLARIGADRKRFLVMIDDLIAELGGERRYSGTAWPFGHANGVRWAPFKEHLAELAEQQRASLANELGFEAPAPDGNT